MIGSKDSNSRPVHLDSLDMAITAGAMLGSAAGAVGGSVVSKLWLGGEYPIAWAMLGCVIGGVLLPMVACRFAEIEREAFADDASLVPSSQTVEQKVNACRHKCRDGDGEHPGDKDALRHPPPDSRYAL